MQIKIKNVEVSTPPGKKYQLAEVVYSDDRGETKTKKLLSFKNPAVFATIKDAKNGDSFDVTSEKIGDYWEWTAASVANSAAPTATKSVGQTRSTYETPEERAARQVLIVKQSCLAQAVAHTRDDNVDAVLEKADRFVEWVFNNPEVKTEQLDDLPF